MAEFARHSGVRIFVAAFAIGAMFTLGSPARAQQQEDQGVLASFISNVLSTPTSRVSIGSVEGPLSSDATIRNVTVADAQGTFLRIDAIRIIWRRAALLSRRIEIQNLEIGKIELSRRPAPPDAAQAQAAASSGPILPELPLKVEVGKFTLKELALGESVIGVAARLGAEGKASLGAPSEGLQATLDVKRLDAAGQSSLRLTFAPATTQLDLAMKHDEPAGGLVARLANLPGLPPVKLDLDGAGKLDDWRARLNFDAGAGIDARGEARLARAGALRRLMLNMNAHVEPLLPPAAATIFAGAVSLTGGAVFGDDGGYGIENIRLASEIAELTLAGRLGADRMLDVTAKARALPNAGGATRKGEASLAQLTFDATAKGPLTAPQVDGKLDLRDLSAPTVKLASLNATLAVDPVRDAPAPRYRLSADGKAEGFALADRGLSKAIGSSGTLVVRGVIDDKGVADFTDARIASTNLAFSYVGRAGASVLDGRARGEIMKLSALSTLVGRALSGRAALQIALKGDPSRSAVEAVLDGAATDLALGDAIADRLTGKRLAFSGKATTQPGAMLLDQVAARGQFIVASLSGRVAADNLGLAADLSLGDLAKLDLRLVGAARVETKLTGPASDPAVNLRATSTNLRAMDRPIRDLMLTLDGSRMGTAPDIALNARGDVDGKALAADVKAAMKDGGWTLSALAARLGSVSANGEGSLSAAGLATGKLTIAAGDLNDLSPLVLTPLRGGLDASLIADARDGRQNIALDANGRRLAAGAATLESLKANLRAEDVFARITVNGDATVDKLVAGGETVERIALNARGAPDATALSLSAQARGFNFATAGRLIPSQPTRFDLASFSAVRGAARIALTSPSTLLIENGGVRTERLALSALGGDIEIKGRVASDLDLAIDVRRLPLSAADVFAPGTGLQGVLDARATLKGAAAAPQGPFEVAIKSLSAPQTRSASLPPLDVTAKGEARGDRASVNARIAGGRALSFEIDGSAPLTATGAFDLRARGNVDAGLGNSMLAGSGQRVAGRIAIDGALRGTRARPDVQGSATLNGGSFSDPLNGVAFTNIEGRVTGRGDAIAVERLTAKAKNGGTVSASGRVIADADRGFPADIKIASNEAELVSSDLASLIANLNLTVSGPLASAPRIGGRIDVRTLEIRVPDRLPSAAEPLRDAKHIAPPPQTRARLAQIARQKASAKRRGGAPFNAALDLAISAPGRVFVRGRGLDAELGGDIRLSGSSREPRAIGAFEMRRGRLSILTQRLDFTRGRLTFSGDVIPDLDFVAETRAADVTARVAVTGRASEPQFALSSTPDLPQDEVLSRLLFARASGGLSPFQAVQLAQAVAQLSGAAGGPDVFEQTRRALGVDDLDVGMSSSGGPTVGVSRAISDRVRVGVKAGTKPENSAVGADIDLMRNFKVQTEIGADGRAAAGVGYELEY
ncbi:translocation/assembly module TamB domain-containing protein [Terrarubrum flagellatum]|uniref:translocation/assembly module TamB domain-containing protein n=1 Tax=Terrirubrum flagellatum TaxID=2895980 RepID=UPI0031453780